MMNFLEPTIHAALFDRATGPDWIGRACAVASNRECVPLLVNYVKYVVEFALPPPAHESSTALTKVFESAHGLTFLPTLDYRGIAIWTGIDGTEEELISGSARLDEQAHAETEKLSGLLTEALRRYFSNHPQITQYFYPRHLGGARFFQDRILPGGHLIPLGKKLTVLDEVAPAYLGFSIESE